MYIPKNRIEREKYTIRVMIGMFCRAHHDTHDGLCPDCQALYDYAMQRIDKCPFIQNKPTCAKCPIHCYRKDMRERVRQVMRYAGPRMAFLHPILTIMHYVDELTKRNSDGVQGSK